ncbi:MAG: hypothetical protein JSW71_18660 [Gemmatimonadota bacterium]|nr:MAG: hypothetical protein JSW71_18660 [Gemmatimonadota bacterium]
MIELKRDVLVFRFPKVHEDAKMRVDFQRTLRIPDDDKDYPLPAGLGRFPLRHVDDFAQRVPQKWIDHGGIMLPMYQSEALWINFSAGQYPFAVKVAAGKINAVTGDSWTDELHREPQDYMVVPHQPWLDGYCIEKGLIRQFVAMPLGSGYSAEEQITGEAEHGGLQIVVYPLKPELYRPVARMTRGGPMFEAEFLCAAAPAAFDMGLAPGGKMRQEIYDDTYELSDWNQERSSRCFVHICNSLAWRAVTQEAPPTTPLTAREYKNYGIPWFEYYADDAKAVQGSKLLGKLKSVAQLGKEKGDVPLPDNESIQPEKIVQLRKGLSKGQVREGTF